MDRVCGLKGFCKDGVCLYEKQALVLINQHANSAATLEDFALLVAAHVKEKTEIDIEWEVRKI